MRFPTSTGVALFLILASALILRCIPVCWGVYPSFHPDEPKLTQAIATFPAKVFETQDLRYPMFIHNVGGFFWRLLHPSFVIFEKAMGLPPTLSSDWAAILFMRLGSVLVGVGTVWLVYKTCVLYLDKTTALIAAALMNLCTYHVLNSAVVTTDVLSSCWVILAVFAIMSVYRCEKILWSHAAWLGLVLGAAVSTKYTLMFLAPFFFLLPLVLAFRQRLSLEMLVLFQLVQFATAVAAFGFFTPAVFVHPNVFVNGILYEYESKGHPFALSCVIDQRMEVFYGLGYINTALLLAGIPFLYRLRRTCVPYLVFVPLIIYLYRMFPSLRARYLIAVAPLVVIIGAQPLRWVMNKHHLARYAVAALLIFGTVHTGFLMAQRYNDTRYLAVEWLEENVPPSTKLGMGGVGSYKCKQHGWTWPILPRDYPRADMLSGPRYLILSSRYYDPVLSALESPGLLEDTSFWKGVGSIPDNAALEFYDDVLNNKGKKYSYRLVREFTPNPVLEFNGDTLRIYEKNTNTAP